MTELVFFAIGVIMSCIADRTWKQKGKSKHIDKRLAFFDHYHWGVLLAGISMIIENPISHVLFGAGIALIVQEIYQEKPFAKNSDHFVMTSAIGAALLVCIIFIILTSTTIHE